MAQPLKELYSPAFIQFIGRLLHQTVPEASARLFEQKVFDAAWPQKELKERMRHIALVLHEFLPAHFPDAATQIRQLVKLLEKQEGKPYSLECMFLPDYVELYGLAHPSVSVKLMEVLTPYTSCEFAVRRFILQNPEPMYRQLLLWSLHPNHHVRRLASEGSRPKLPWAVALPELIRDPSPVLPILNNLKNDPSDYVRRSVANHLNDISKDHPDLVLQIIHSWKGVSTDTDALLKHAARTLLKAGNPKAMALFGWTYADSLQLKRVKLHTTQIAIGEALHFSFDLFHDEKTPQAVRLEYAIYYLLQNGRHSKKVFKISERLIKHNEVIHIEKKHSFRLITTKTFYAGIHHVGILVNGTELKKHAFHLNI